MIHRKNATSQLKSLKHTSHLTTRQRIVLILTAVALSIIILFSMWIMRKGKARIPTNTLPIVERGAIYDRRGHILATQVVEYTISLWLPTVRNEQPYETNEEYLQSIRALSTHLAPIILWPQTELYDRILAHPSNTLTLLRRADVQIKERVEGGNA